MSPDTDKGEVLNVFFASVFMRKASGTMYRESSRCIRNISSTSGLSQGSLKKNSTYRSI